MPNLWNLQTQKPEWVRPESVAAALASGSYQEYEGSAPAFDEPGVPGLTRTEGVEEGALRERTGVLPVASADIQQRQRETEERAALDTLGNEALALFEGGLAGASAGLLDPADWSEEAAKRRDVNPFAGGLGMAGGAVAGSLAGTGPAGWLTRGATRAADAAVLASGAKTAAGRLAVREATQGALEGVGFAAGAQAGGALWADRPFSAEALVTEGGLGMFLGAGLAGARLGAGKVVRRSVERADAVKGADDLLQPDSQLSKGLADDFRAVGRAWDDELAVARNRAAGLKAAGELPGVDVRAGEKALAAAEKARKDLELALGKGDPWDRLEAIMDTGTPQRINRAAKALDRYGVAVGKLDDSFRARAAGDADTLVTGPPSFVDDRTLVTGRPSFIDDRTLVTGGPSFVDDRTLVTGKPSFIDDRTLVTGRPSFIDDRTVVTGRPSFDDDHTLVTGRPSFDDDHTLVTGRPSFVDDLTVVGPRPSMGDTALQRRLPTPEADTIPQVAPASRISPLAGDYVTESMPGLPVAAVKAGTMDTAVGRGPVAKRRGRGPDVAGFAPLDKIQAASAKAIADYPLAPRGSVAPMHPAGQVGLSPAGSPAVKRLAAILDERLGKIDAALIQRGASMDMAEAVGAKVDGLGPLGERAVQLWAMRKSTRGLGRSRPERSSAGRMLEEAAALGAGAITPGGFFVKGAARSVARSAVRAAVGVGESIGRVKVGTARAVESALSDGRRAAIRRGALAVDYGEGETRDFNEKARQLRAATSDPDALRNRLMASPAISDLRALDPDLAALAVEAAASRVEALAAALPPEDESLKYPAVQASSVPRDSDAVHQWENRERVGAQPELAIAMARAGAVPPEVAEALMETQPQLLMKLSEQLLSAGPEVLAQAPHETLVGLSTLIGFPLVPEADDAYVWRRQQRFKQAREKDEQTQQRQAGAAAIKAGTVIPTPGQYYAAPPPPPTLR